LHVLELVDILEMAINQRGIAELQEMLARLQLGRMGRDEEHVRGGHFAAMETPDLLVEDVRADFRQLR